MKSMKSAVYVFAVLFLATLCVGCMKADKLENQGNTSVFTKLKKGINQDAGMPMLSGNRVQYERAHMQAISEAGFESVRFFISYDSDFNEYETRIQDALDYDLVVVVGIWGANEWSTMAIDVAAAQLADRWKTIAQAWAGKFSNEVMFEILNEPAMLGFKGETSNPNVMKLYNAAILAIREVDLDRPILVGMPGLNDADQMDPWLTEQYLNYSLSDGTGFFDDKNMGVSIHFYKPWHSDGNNWAMWEENLKEGWKATIDYQINHAVDWRKKYKTNMPVVVTEWGCWMFEKRTKGTDLPMWLDYHMQLFEKHNIGSMWYTGVYNNQRQFCILDTELGWNQVVLDKLTGITPPPIPSMSQIIDAEFTWGTNAWKLTSPEVEKSWISIGKISGSRSLKLSVPRPMDCQMYQQTYDEDLSEPQAPGRTLLHLIKEKTYKLSFMAKTESGEGKVKVALKDVNNLKTEFFDGGYEIVTTSPQTFSYQFTHTDSTAMDVRLEFDIGSVAQTLIMDKVVLRGVEEVANK